VIFRLIRPGATRARGRVRVGCEFSPRSLRNLACFLAAQTHARLGGEEEFMRLDISLIPNHPCSDLDFCGVGDLCSFSLRRAWARALKNRANHLSLLAKTCAQLMPTLGRELHAGRQK
jgi:hypothetical protein